MLDRRGFLQAVAAVVAAVSMPWRKVAAAAPLVPRGFHVSSSVLLEGWDTWRKVEWRSDGSYAEDGIVMPESIPCPWSIIRDAQGNPSVLQLDWLEGPGTFQDFYITDGVVDVLGLPAVRAGTNHGLLDAADRGYHVQVITPDGRT